VSDVDQVGLLADLAAAFSAAGCDIHSAHAMSGEGQTVDSFDLTDGHGAKLPAAMQRRVEEVIAAGSASASQRARWIPFRTV